MDPVFFVDDTFLSNCDADRKHLFQKGFWYFWNETWSDAEGPYDSEFIAREWLRRYLKQL